MAGGGVGGGRNGVVETENILSVFVKLIKNIFKLYIHHSVACFVRYFKLYIHQVTVASIRSVLLPHLSPNWEQSVCACNPVWAPQKLCL